MEFVVDSRPPDVHRRGVIEQVFVAKSAPDHGWDCQVLRSLETNLAAR